LKIPVFKPGWPASLAAALWLPLFVFLGVWQLHRAEEKTTLMAQRESRQAEPVLAGGLEWAKDDNRYRRVELEGEYDAAHQVLLDNQIHQQQAGYFVMTPLRIAGTDAAVLVNRGWVPMGKDRSHLPELPIGQTQAHITALIDRFPGVGFKLAGAEIPTPGWPAVAQVLDAQRLSERLGYRLLPYQVLLPADAPDGFVREWRQASLNPEKNQGYALQWFSFALVLSVLYVWHGFKPKRPD